MPPIKPSYPFKGSTGSSPEYSLGRAACRPLYPGGNKSSREDSMPRLFSEARLTWSPSRPSSPPPFLLKSPPSLSRALTKMSGSWAQLVCGVTASKLSWFKRKSIYQTHHSQRWSIKLNCTMRCYLYVPLNEILTTDSLILTVPGWSCAFFRQGTPSTLTNVVIHMT